LTDADLTRDEALDYLSATKEELIRQHPEASVQTRLLQGTIADTIIDFAEDEDIGLIITTTLGSSGFRRWLMGSTAEKIVRYAPCPVLSIGRKSLKKHAQD
jgi:nucleotide-binding universal stress UspA family protein